MGVEGYAFLSLQFLLPLFAVAISEGIIFYYVLWRFIRTFCADKKYQKALRMDAFLTPNEADDFWALRNSLG